MGQPSKAALDNPAASEDDEALLSRFAYHDVVTHAVRMRPILATPGDE